MIVKEDRELAEKTLRRIVSKLHDAERLAILADVIEDVRTSAWARGYSAGSGKSAPSGSPDR